MVIRIPSGRIGSILREHNLNGLLNQRLFIVKNGKKLSTAFTLILVLAHGYLSMRLGGSLKPLK